jgi:simple sugar transport system substrate-binding protein
MTDLHKRTLLKVAAMSAVAAAALVGCGKKEEPAPAPAPAPAPVTEAPAPKPEPLKIAFAYVGPVGDGGWSYAHDNGRKALEKEFGDKIVTSFVESVPESADAERVLRDMAGQGKQADFWHHLRLHGIHAQGGCGQPRHQVRARDRLQDRREHAHL